MVRASLNNKTNQRFALSRMVEFSTTKQWHQSVPRTNSFFIVDIELQLSVYIRHYYVTLSIPDDD